MNIITTEPTGASKLPNLPNHTCNHKNLKQLVQINANKHCREKGVCVCVCVCGGGGGGGGGLQKQSSEGGKKCLRLGFHKGYAQLWM